MKKRLLVRIPILLFIVLMGWPALAQKRTISGTVTDVRDGSPLAGVSVLPKGGNTGVATGADGSFHIAVDPGIKTLIFSFVGYSTREIPITDGPLRIALTSSNAALNEIVVIGYGTARKKDLTGAVAIVGEKDFQKGAFTTPEQMIAGKVAGVSIISNSGQPGAGSTIRIRGGSSLNASNDPLIVIDGVPMDNDIAVGQKSVIAGAGNPLSFVNPDDIETFTVLKDASSAAIYGTRAANGVILITTKRGKSGAPKINLNSVNSLASLTKKVSVLNAAQFRSVVNANGDATKKAMLGAANTDWQDQIFQDALGTNNNLSISGGVKKLPYRVSVGYQDQNGILRTDNLKRLSVGLMLNPVLFDNHLRIDLSLKGSKENTRFGNQAAIGGAISFDPTQPVYVKSPRFGGYYEWLDATTPTGLANLAGRNPLGLLNQHYDKSHPERSIGNIQLDYKFHFLPDLHANVNAGYDISRGQGSTFIPDSAAEAYVAGGTGGSNNPYKTNKTNTLFEFYFHYVKEIKSIKSHLEFTPGYSYYDYKTTVYNYPTFNARGVKFPGSDPATPTNGYRHVLISYFGRLQYTYNDKYVLQASLRRDGSSRFAPGNRWGLFPAVAFAWKMKEESFLQSSNVISDLKLRAGYGVTGQQDGIGDYDYLSYYYLSNAAASYQFDSLFYQGYRPSGFYANRKWEQTATYNVAIDYGLLDGKITGSVDFYYKKTTNLLNQVSQPAGSNFSAYIIANVGSMENKGVEFELGLHPIRRRELTWDMSFNVTYNQNKITNLTVVPDDPNYPGFASGTIAGGIGGQFALINAVGYSKSIFNLYKQVYDASGKPIEGVFVDKNHDGIINQNDLFKSKPADPKVFLGFSTGVTYHKWNAGFVLRSSIGNYVYNNIQSQTGVLTQITGNPVLYNGSTNYLVTKFKGSNAQQLLSDYYIENGSFLRMDNFNVGYDMGRIAHTKVRLRLNASVQNVFVITRYSGLDPEIGAGTANNPGIDNNLYPRPRTYALGVSLDY
ncbi:MAG TPA: TonB-dependent receptor [Puia sp.]|nr:TonB-dependent receptor [Puia sp.]